MSAMASCRLLVKQWFGHLTGVFCAEFVLVRQPVLIAGGAHRTSQWTVQHHGLARSAARIRRRSPQCFWPARHPAEMALLNRQARSKCHDRRR